MRISSIAPPVTVGRRWTSSGGSFHHIASPGEQVVDRLDALTPARVNRSYRSQPSTTSAAPDDRAGDRRQFALVKEPHGQDRPALSLTNDDCVLRGENLLADGRPVEWDSDQCRAAAIPRWLRSALIWK